MRTPLIPVAHLAGRPGLGPLILAEQDVRSRSTGVTYTPRQLIALLRLAAAVHADQITDNLLEDPRP